MRIAPRRLFRAITSLGLSTALVVLAPGMGCYEAVAGVVRARVAVPSFGLHPNFAPAPRIDSGFSLSRLGPNVDLGTLRLAGSVDGIVPVSGKVSSVSSLSILKAGGARLASSSSEGEKRGVLNRLFTGLAPKPEAEVAVDGVLPTFVSGLERLPLASLAEGALDKSLTLAERVKVVESIARRKTWAARVTLKTIGAYDPEGSAADYEVKRAALKLLAEQGVVVSLPPISKAHAEQILQKLSAEKPEAAIFDYDDTLEAEKTPASPETAQALKDLADAGIETMILTARSDASILESLSTLTPAQKAKLTLGAERGARMIVFGKDGQASVVREQPGAADKSLGVLALRAESSFYARARDVLRFVPKSLRGWATKLVARLPKKPIPAANMVLVGDHFEGKESIDGPMIKGAPGALALSVGGFADPRLENVFVWPEKGPAGTRQVMAAMVRKRAGDFNKKAIAGLFAQRTVSITAFIITSIAYPFLAIPIVGAVQYGALMALGPVVAIATGQLNAVIAQRLSARNAMALNAVIRAVLALALPAFAFLGVLNFWTLLIASIANGWVMSSIMTTENIYVKRLSGPHLGTVTAATWINYYAIQVVLTLFVGIGGFVDKWNLMVPFLISAAAHAFIVMPIIWKTMPNIIPVKSSVQKAIAPFKEKAAAFLKQWWKEALVFAGGVAMYAAWGSTLPIAAALVWWIRGTDGFKALWANKALRNGLLFAIAAAFLFFPLQSMTLPLIAKALAGEAGKAALLGQLIGALFFGQLIANTSQTQLGRVRLPFVGRFPAERLIQTAVLGLAGAWVYLSLAPGSLLAAAAAVGLGAALMAMSARMTERGWMKFLGIGLLFALVPLLAWGNIPLLFASLLMIGLFYGPANVAFSAYFFRNIPKDKIESMIGVQGALFNAAITIGFGVMSLVISRLAAPAFPAALGVIGVAFVIVGALAWFAPRFLPGLPGSVFKKKGEK